MANNRGAASGALSALETSEIRLSALENNFTLGAEYYSPGFVRCAEVLRRSALSTRSLGDCCSLVTDGDHGSADYSDHGVLFVLSEAVEAGVIRKAACRYITPEYATTLARATLRAGDVLVTKTGVYFGKSAVVDATFAGATAIAHVGILRPRSEIDPYVLSTFLNCSYGQSELRRRGIKATRPEIKLVELRDVRVPLVSRALSERLGYIVRAARGQFELEETLRVRAQNNLASGIGWSENRISSQLSYECEASKVVSAGRFDAEYFDPGTVNLIELLRMRSAKRLEEVCTVGTGFPWSSEAFLGEVSTDGEPFVRIRDCKPGYLEPENLDRLDHEYATSQGQPRATAGDVVLGMDGLKWFYASLLTGSAYINQRVAHMHVTDPRYSPELLMVYINSQIGQRQLLRAMTIASTVGHITLDDVRGLLIAPLGEDVHGSVLSLTREAFAAQTKAWSLLERAKAALEVAIESGEALALSTLGGL